MASLRVIRFASVGAKEQHSQSEDMQEHTSENTVTFHTNSNINTIDFGEAGDKLAGVTSSNQVQKLLDLHQVLENLQSYCTDAVQSGIQRA